MILPMKENEEWREVGIKDLGLIDWIKYQYIKLTSKHPIKMRVKKEE